MLNDMAGNIVAGWTAFCGAPQRVAGCWLLDSGSQPAPATSRQQPINVTKNTIVAGAMYAFG
jgi:hypothetical protein